MGCRRLLTAFWSLLAQIVQATLDGRVRQRINNSGVEFGNDSLGRTLGRPHP